MTGTENSLESSLIELVPSLKGKQKFQRRNKRIEAGKVLRFNLVGKRFLGGLSFTLAGQCFSGVVTRGCFGGL